MAELFTSLAAANTVGSFVVANSLAQYLDFSLIGSSTKRPLRIKALVARASSASQSFTDLLCNKYSMCAFRVSLMLCSLRKTGSLSSLDST